MSNAVTALKAAVFTDGIADVSLAPLQGMITLRGDLSAEAIAKAVKGATGTTIPEAGQAVFNGDTGVCWMSPDEVLVLCPYDNVSTFLAQMQTALSGVHALAVDVSDARAVFEVSGAHGREVMAKLAPVNLSPDGFQTGMFRRTRMAQIPAAFWMSDEQTFRIICFRSNAQYMFDLLKAAAQKGSAPGIF